MMSTNEVFAIIVISIILGKHFLAETVRRSSTLVVSILLRTFFSR